MSASPVEVALPSGRLSLSGDGAASVLLRVSIRNRDALLAAVESMSRLDPHRFWLCARHREEAEGLRLEYAKPPGEVTPLARLVGGWRAEPAAALARALDLVRRLLHATGELEQLRPSHFPLSPAQVFAVRDEAGKERWLVLPLPLERTAFADFVRADEDCRAWLSADEMFAAARPDRAYTVGAALHHCLVGPLFPAEAGRAERVRRLILYRAGRPDVTLKAVKSALPDSEAAAASRLADFITGLLAPPPGRALTAVQVFRELDRFFDELSPHRLACLWEAAGDDQKYVQRAHAIIESLVAAAPDYDVPWDAVERLRAKVGDHAGAADAGSRRPRPPARSQVVEQVQALVGGGDERRRELERLTSMVRELAASDGLIPEPAEKRGPVQADPEAEPKLRQHQLGEEEYLYLTYAHGRWLGFADEALLWLRRDFAVSWNKVVSCVLAARLCADREDWIKTAAHCRDGRRRVAQVSDSGGAPGRYVTAYLDLLDGVAHVCAVHRQRHAHVYLSDAFDRLRGAWEGLSQAGDEEAGEHLAGWLSLLGDVAGRDPRLKILSLGVEAFLQSRGVRGGGGGRRGGDGGLPPIPWFDEARVFTALYAGARM